MEAIRYAKKQNIRTLAIINVKGSTMSQLVDYPLFTNAGPEIAVASTKAYTSQLSLLYLAVAENLISTKCLANMQMNLGAILRTMAVI